MTERFTTHTRLAPSSAPDAARADDWRERAACVGAPDEVFYPDRGNTAGSNVYRRARRICSRCPVVDQCLNLAMATEPRSDSGRYGMFGGLTPGERASLAMAT